MKWVIVTCEASRHIRPVQEWLFKKYAPDADLFYIDLGVNDINKWGSEVAEHLPDIRPKVPVATNDNILVVFGLDDYLPTAPISVSGFKAAEKLMGHKYSWGFYERFELSYGAKNKGPFMKNGQEPFKRKPINSLLDVLEFREHTPYSVSCQFSIWDYQALKRILKRSTTPWNFEIKNRARAACFNQGVLRYIEESALSKRWPGMINVNGMQESDVIELTKAGLLDESKLINRG